MSVDLDNSSTVSGDASFSSTGNQNPPPKKKRNLPGMPDPDAEVIALSPKTLMATNRFFCEICNQGFQRDQNLQLHRRGHNLPWKLRQRSSNEVRKKVYVCPVSGCVHHEPSRGLGDLTGIKKHFCRKHGEKKWKCEKCSKKYAVQSDWKAHSKICGTKEYKCDCGTLFSRRDIFITHRAFCDALAEESAKNHTQSKKLYPETVIKRKNTEPDHKSPSTVDSPPPPPPPPQSQQPHSPPSVALAPVPAISVETESVKITSSSVLPIQSSPVYRKHYPPYPDSEVWRLDNIAKNRLLAQAGIHTVKDLRRYLAVHSNTFPQILEGKISEERWNAIVSHSMDCVLDEKECYIYNSKAHGAFLLFNSVYEVMKVSFDGITVLNTTDLTSTQQETLGMLKREAYENVDCFVAADFLNFLQRSSSSLQDAELSICVPKPQGIILDEESDFSELSGSIDVYEPLDTCVASSASLDYDVVIRYRRGDVSNDDFISHLRAALCRRGISVHEDFDEVDGAPECRVLILFITSSYVPSNLLNILEHQQIESQVVYPLFYGMSPSDLISNSKNYERFFLQDEPKWWQAALKEIAQMPGYILTDKSESELIDEIVRDTSKVLCSIDKENMMGMDMQIKEIMSLLCIESPDVRSIGLWGTVGIGKTAIAEEIFCRISVQYESCVFLNDLHKEVEAKGQDALREDFLSKVLEVEPLVIRFSDIKASFLRSRLQSKKVLVILDNVNDFRDVETFLGKLKYFGPGSRVIITSRNRHVFVQCKIDNVYEVKPLDLSNSLLLLESGTFRSVLSPRPNRALSLELVRFSSGNPRVLQFFSESVKEWKRLSQQIQKSSPIYIEDIFERCCCGLDDNERSIFLDIACFFRKMDKDDVAMLLDGCGFSARVGFRSLVDKSLLTISHDVLGMLRFIQATGREIVRQESQWPEYCSRLWDPEDIMDVFIHNKGTSTIEGIFLDMSRLKFDANPNIFEKMCNLRLLKIYSSGVMENTEVSLPQGLEYLPSKLRLLHWEYYPLSSLPRSFDPKNLVELNLPSSCAKKLWKGKKSLEKLRKMRLSYSYQLTKIPRLSNSPNLELIDLEGCNSLVSISQSISSLKKLVFLNLKDCSKLESIPSTVDLEALEVLNLSGCSKVENYPEVSPNVKELYLGGTMIQEIPSSIKNLVLLEKLDLENSRHLVNLPMSICKLKNLETLNLSGCTSLERFPDLSRRMKSLKSLDLSRTAIRELPSSISYLTALEELRFVDCRNLVKLPDNVWSLRFKVEFRQIDTEKFSRLWNRLGWLKKVQIS